MKRIFVPLTPIVAVVIAAVAAFTILADEVPWNTYVVDRTVEVSPGARKNKAFPMEEGSAFCDRNDAFGKKKAILLLNGRKLDESDYEVFFPKNATNHPGGQAGSPNWFYYWKEGGVCGIPSDCIFDPQAEYGWTQPWTDNIVRIGIDAAEINTGPETYTSRLAGFGSITTTGTGRGIKCVAETIQHEQHHLYLYKTYHGFGADPDSDGIPSLVEPTEDGVVSCPTNSDTYRLGGDYCPYGDNEVRCRRIEMRLTITIRPAQDWANPGCQSFSQFGPHP